MTVFTNFIANLFTEPTIGLYRECTGRERIDRQWWKCTKELAQEGALVLTCLALLYAVFPLFK